MPDERISLSVERYKALRQHELELNKATAAFEHASLQPLTYLNGGALAAFMALIGAIWKDAQSSLVISNVKWALIAWSAGLISAAFSTGMAYRSQRYFSIGARLEREAFEDIAARQAKLEDAESQRQEAKRDQNRAVGFGLISLFLFILGVLSAFLALGAEQHPFVPLAE
jgi:hypothetical protein